MNVKGQDHYYAAASQKVKDIACGSVGGRQLIAITVGPLQITAASAIQLTCCGFYYVFRGHFQVSSKSREKLGKAEYLAGYSSYIEQY